MNIHMLFICVLILTIFNYVLQERDVLSPSLWACIMFLISIFINILNTNRWGSNYSFKSAIIILIGLFSIIIGEFFVSKIFYPTLSRKYKLICANKPINLKFITLFWVILLSFFCLIIDLIIVMRISGTSDIFSSLYFLRNILISGEGSKGFIGRLVFATQKSIAFIFIFVLLYNKIICRAKLKLLYILPISLFIIEGILTTGRTIYIRILVYSFFIFIQLYVYKNSTKFIHLTKIALTGAMVLIVFFIIFTFLGKLIGKGIYNSSLEVFSYYAGSPIYLFNLYIDNVGQVTNNTLWGEHTFIGIYNILHYINSSIPHISNPALEMAYIPHWYSNIYTAFRRYYQDFGITGVIVIPFIIGIFYGWAKNRILYGGNIIWKCMFFAFTIYPIIEIAIEERFFVNLISFSSLFELIIFYIMYNLIIKYKFTIKLNIDEYDKTCNNTTAANLFQS